MLYIIYINLLEWYGFYKEITLIIQRKCWKKYDILTTKLVGIKAFKECSYDISRKPFLFVLW